MNILLVVLFWAAISFLFLYFLGAICLCCSLWSALRKRERGDGDDWWRYS
jgi:hypothetical protein